MIGLIETLLALFLALFAATAGEGCPEATAEDLSCVPWSFYETPEPRPVLEVRPPSVSVTTPEGALVETVPEAVTTTTAPPAPVTTTTEAPAPTVPPTVPPPTRPECLEDELYADTLPDGTYVHRRCLRWST